MGQDEFVATWLWNVSTQNGDAIVEPGETATITLSIDFTPNVGEPGKTGSVINGLNFAVFDVLGGPGAANGTILGWSIDPLLLFSLGDTTTTDGTSLFGTTIANFPQNYNSDDPIVAISFDWQPSEFVVQRVAYTTRTLGVWVDEGFFPIEWDVVEANVAFAVVPAPELLPWCAILAGLSVRTRRRS